MLSKPICVISGDIHYSLNNLTVADAATRMAIAHANKLQVPFVANGDTTDTKAILRAECVNAMIETFKTAELLPIINIGNHCKIHAKSKEHALNFLRPYAQIVNEPQYVPILDSYVIPYFDDVEELRSLLQTLPAKSRLIMHQGLSGSNYGDYIQDKSALVPADLAEFRTILSHYHARQDIKCGDAGLASYIGSAFTTTFGESADLPKGFQVLMDDGSLEFVPTNLRKHVVVSLEVVNLDVSPRVYRRTDINVKIVTNDIVLVKIAGSADQLSTITKDQVKADLHFTQDFRLDLIPDDVTPTATETQVQTLTQPDLLDSMIDSTDIDDKQKSRLKHLWKDLK